MINLTTNTKSFSVEKGTAGGKTGSGGSSSKVIKQIIYQGGGSGGNSVLSDVFTGATAVNPGKQGLVPQPLAGQDTLFLKGNGLWDKVFKNIREDEEGNIYIDGKATKFGSPIYLNDIFSNSTDPDENLRKIGFHDNVKFDKNLEVNGKSDFTGDIIANNIKVDNLTVNKLAHFFQLVIDEVKSSQGQIIISNAHAKIDYVEKVDGGTILWWRHDGENYEIRNQFLGGDQILCQTFNRGQRVMHDSGVVIGQWANKYYWVVINDTRQHVKRVFPNIDGTHGEPHFYNGVIISDDDAVSPKNGSFLPEIGDEIVQLGNRSNTTRQAAIIISAYNAYDKEIKAPAIVQYDGINDFDLKSHRLNVISKGLNRFLGTCLTPDGDDYVTSSVLQQTSDEILAAVGKTYIKINDGKVIINAAVDEKTGEIRDDIDSIKRGNIELNGNTTVNGNLTIQNATDGLTLVGTGGTTEIRSKNIGNFFDYIKNPTKYWLMTQTTNGPGMMMYQDGSVNKEKFVNDNDEANQTIQIPANTKVSFTGAAVVFVEQSLKNMGFIPRVTRDPENLNRYIINVPDNSLTFIQFIVKKFELILTFINKDTGAVIKTFTNVDHGEFSVTEAVPNCKIRCQVYAYIDKWIVWKESFSYNGKNYTLGSNSKVDLVNWAVPIGLTNFTLTSQDPTVNNLIGYNGQAYNFGGGNGMFIGKTGLQAKFGDYTFMINPSTIRNATESGTEVFREGIWSVNKYRFTTPQGPFTDFETSKSQFLTQGRGFGVKNVRAPGTSGKILVLPEDDIILVSEFSFVSGNMGNIDVEIYFPPCNETTFIGHEITIMQIHEPNSPTTSTCKIFTTDNRYPLYKQDGTSFTSYTLDYETRTFIPNFLMGRWVML